MFDLEKLEIPDVKVITPKRFGDDRGFFSTTWQRDFFEKNGMVTNFDFDAFSYTADALTLRGMHYQIRPHVQTKLVRVLRGSIFDVVVDIRKSSKTFGQWAGVTLSADNAKMLYAPAGFAHGFMTLEPGTEVSYKIKGPYSPDDERGINWADADLAITWPLDGQTPDTNERDNGFPALKDAADFL